jgi:hypothetical protein
VTDFLTHFNEVAAKAEEHGALLSISLIIPREIQESMVYTVKKISDTEDPIEGLDTIDVYIDTPEFAISLEKGLNLIDEHEDAKALDAKLSEMKFEVNAVDLLWILNGANAGVDRTRSVLERSLGKEKYDEAVGLVRKSEQKRLLNVIAESYLEDDYTEVTFPKDDTDEEAAAT